jgi:hypothetical protein
MKRYRPEAAAPRGIKVEVEEQEGVKEEIKDARSRMQLRRVRDSKGSSVLCNSRVEN